MLEMQLDECLTLLDACADNTSFPEKELRDTFFHAHAKEHQAFLKFTNDHEKLTFEEVEEIYEKFEINQLTSDKGKDTSVPSGKKRKVSIASTVSDLSNKKQKRSDKSDKWCFKCAEVGKKPYVVKSHNAQDCKAESGDNDSKGYNRNRNGKGHHNRKKDFNPETLMSTISKLHNKVADLTKKVNKKKNKRSRDDDSDDDS